MMMLATSFPSFFHAFCNAPDNGTLCQLETLMTRMMMLAAPLHQILKRLPLPVEAPPLPPPPLLLMTLERQHKIVRYSLFRSFPVHDAYLCQSPLCMCECALVPRVYLFGAAAMLLTTLKAPSCDLPLFLLLLGPAIAAAQFVCGCFPSFCCFNFGVLTFKMGSGTNKLVVKSLPSVTM